MLGDMHLANRTGDLGQFAQFTSDLTDYMTRHKGERRCMRSPPGT